MYSMAEKEVLLHEIAISVRANVDNIFQLDFFNALRYGTLSLDGLKRFASEYYLASNGFPKLLAVACASMPTDELRLPFVSNLWDELGRGEIVRSHRMLLAKFLNHLQVSSGENPNGPADRYLLAMASLAQNATTAKVLGMFGPGCEAFTPREYRLFVESFVNKYAIPHSALEFFVDHIEHDGSHLDALKNAIELSLFTRRDVDDVILGAQEAIAVEKEFWIDMYTYCA